MVVIGCLATALLIFVVLVGREDELR